MQNLIFMLVGVNVMATSNFDANSKESERGRQDFALQEPVPG